MRVKSILGIIEGLLVVPYSSQLQILESAPFSRPRFSKSSLVLHSEQLDRVHRVRFNSRPPQHSLGEFSSHVGHGDTGPDDENHKSITPLEDNMGIAITS